MSTYEMYAEHTCNVAQPPELSWTLIVIYPWIRWFKVICFALISTYELQLITYFTGGNAAKKSEFGKRKSAQRNQLWYDRKRL